MAGYSGRERRSGNDRRSNPVAAYKFLVFNGRRKSSRRIADRRRIVAYDHYTPSLFFGVIIVLGLSLLDAMLTLLLLSQGASELNPLMNYYLSHGPRVFLSVKYGLTAVPVIVVLLLKDVLVTRYRIGSTALLHIFAAVFGSVVIWQCYLLSISPMMR